MGKWFKMLVADDLIGSQIIGFTAIKFNRLGKCRRAPRGRVDWNICIGSGCRLPVVAPRVGAWIETIASKLSTI